jgi:hypothetical protein
MLGEPVELPADLVGRRATARLHLRRHAEEDVGSSGRERLSSGLRSAVSRRDAKNLSSGIVERLEAEERVEDEVRERQLVQDGGVERLRFPRVGEQR